MPDEIDPVLLTRFVAGEEAAFETLYRRFHRDAYGWIVRIVRDPAAAEDVLVDTFWRAYRSRARFDPDRSFGAWLRKIATNAALDELQRLRRVSQQSSDVDRFQSQDSAVHDTELREAVRLAFRRLPPKLYVVAVLALVEDRPHSEIARELGLPLGTVKSRVHRATNALRAELGRLGVSV